MKKVLRTNSLVEEKPPQQDKFVKKWKKYVKTSFPYQILCDMDGVLVDFLNPIVNLMNQKIKDLSLLPPKAKKYGEKTIEYLKRAGRDYISPKDLVIGGPKDPRDFMFELIRGNVKFWANLPWATGGRELWNYIKKYKPFILTTPADKASMYGKKIWAKKNLGISEDKIFFTRQKYKFSKDENNEPNLLIDDFKSNVAPFIENGGKAILHKANNYEKTIYNLETLVSEPDEEKNKQKK